MGLNKYIIIIILIIFPIIIDVFRLRKIHKLKDHTFIFIFKIFSVIFSFISIKFGIDIMNCIYNLKDDVCNFSELNTLVFGIGIAFLLIGIIGYVFTLIMLDYSSLKNK